MKILVTGGAGYIGSVLCPLLLASGHQVRVIDNFMYGGNSLKETRKHPSFRCLEGDIRDQATVESALKGVDAVVHLAAIVGDSACARQPKLASTVNLDASIRLFELCQHRGVSRFVFASSCSNYGKMSDPSRYVDEESELRPVSLYAEHKVAVEKALLGVPTSNDMAVTVLRFATAFGLSPRMRFDLTVNEFTVKLLIQKKITVYGEQFWRPYLHVQDIARSVTMVMATPPDRVKGQVFNIGDTRLNYQKGQLIEMICARLGGKVQVEHIYKEEDPRDYRVSFEKIGRELGFRSTRSVEDGVQEIIEAINRGEYTDFDNPYYQN